MGDIVDFTGDTTLPVAPDKILKGALGELENVVLCGWDKEGALYLASSDTRVADILLLLKRSKQMLME